MSVLMIRDGVLEERDASEFQTVESLQEAVGGYFEEFLLAQGKNRRRVVALWDEDARMKNVPVALTVEFEGVGRFEVRGPVLVGTISIGGELVNLSSGERKLLMWDENNRNLLVLRAT